MWKFGILTFFILLSTPASNQFLPATCQYTTKCIAITEPKAKTDAYCLALVGRFNCLVKYGIKDTSCLFDIVNIRTQLSETSLDIVTMDCGVGSLVPSLHLLTLVLITTTTIVLSKW